MKNITILPTANVEWGFWGTSNRNGYNTYMAWDAASCALAKVFKLSPEQTRDLLDARFGRLLADDLSFIEGGPTNAQTIIDHITNRIANIRWRYTFFERAVREVKSA